MMQQKKEHNNQIPGMIDYLLKVDDPATVGLRRILKKKKESGEDFPVHSMALEELRQGSTNDKRVFDGIERRVLVLEKESIELKNQLKQQAEKTQQAEKDARTAGYKDGFTKGETVGHEKANAVFVKKFSEIEKKLSTIIGQIASTRADFLKAAHHEVLNIAFCIAEKVVNTEITVNSEVVLSVVKRALSYLADRQEYVLRVAPDDVTTLTGKKDFWTSISDRMDKVSIQEDARIEKGGCIVESAGGFVDARISVQLEELRRIIENEWESVSTSSVITKPGV